MREILFRGKRTDNGEWVEGYLYRISEKLNPSIMPKNRRAESHEVVPETVGQYTGLTDKNGKPIFEGDIVESRASENPLDWKRWKVEFFDGSFNITMDWIYRKKPKHAEDVLCSDAINLYGLVVIGNIHDNPELLED